MDKNEHIKAGGTGMLIKTNQISKDGGKKQKHGER